MSVRSPRSQKGTPRLMGVEGQSAFVDWHHILSTAAFSIQADDQTAASLQKKEKALLDKLALSLLDLGELASDHADRKQVERVLGCVSKLAKLRESTELVVNSKDRLSAYYQATEGAREEGKERELEETRLQLKDCESVLSERTGEMNLAIQRAASLRKELDQMTAAKGQAEFQTAFYRKIAENSKAKAKSRLLDKMQAMFKHRKSEVRATVKARKEGEAGGGAKKRKSMKAEGEGTKDQQGSSVGRGDGKGNEGRGELETITEGDHETDVASDPDGSQTNGENGQEGDREADINSDEEQASSDSDQAEKGHKPANRSRGGLLRLLSGKPPRRRDLSRLFQDPSMMMRSVTENVMKEMELDPEDPEARVILPLHSQIQIETVHGRNLREILEGIRGSAEGTEGDGTGGEKGKGMNADEKGEVQGKKGGNGISCRCEEALEELLGLARFGFASMEKGALVQRAELLEFERDQVIIRLQETAGKLEELKFRIANDPSKSGALTDGDRGRMLAEVTKAERRAAVAELVDSLKRFSATLASVKKRREKSARLLLPSIEADCKVTSALCEKAGDPSSRLDAFSMQLPGLDHLEPAGASASHWTQQDTEALQDLDREAATRAFSPKEREALDLLARAKAQLQADRAKLRRLNEVVHSLMEDNEELELRLTEREAKIASLEKKAQLCDRLLKEKEDAQTKLSIEIEDEDEYQKWMIFKDKEKVKQQVDVPCLLRALQESLDLWQRDRRRLTEALEGKEEAERQLENTFRGRKQEEEALQNAAALETALVEVQRGRMMDLDDFRERLTRSEHRAETLQENLEKTSQQRTELLEMLHTIGSESGEILRENQEMKNVYGRFKNLLHERIEEKEQERSSMKTRDRHTTRSLYVCRLVSLHFSTAMRGFLFLDKTQSGAFRYPEFKDRVKSLHPQCPQQMVQQAFDALDPTGDGNVTTSEFLSVVRADKPRDFLELTLRLREFGEGSLATALGAAADDPVTLDQEISQKGFVSFTKQCGFDLKETERIWEKLDRGNAGFVTIGDILEEEEHARKEANADRLENEVVQHPAVLLLRQVISPNFEDEITSFVAAAHHKKKLDKRSFKRFFTQLDHQKVLSDKKLEEAFAVIDEKRDGDLSLADWVKGFRKGKSPSPEELFYRLAKVTAGDLGAALGASGAKEGGEISLDAFQRLGNKVGFSREESEEVFREIAGNTADSIALQKILDAVERWRRGGGWREGDGSAPPPPTATGARWRLAGGEDQDFAIDEALMPREDPKNVRTRQTLDSEDPNWEEIQPADLVRAMATLRRCAVLNELEEDTLLEMCSRGLEKRIYRRLGDCVIRQHEPADRWFLIEEGRVAVVAVDDFGRRSPVAFIREGEMFGEMGVVSGRVRSKDVVVARTPLTLYSLKDNLFLRYFDTPEKRQKFLDYANARAMSETKITVVRPRTQGMQTMLKHEVSQQADLPTPREERETQTPSVLYRPGISPEDTPWSRRLQEGLSPDEMRVEQEMQTKAPFPGAIFEDPQWEHESAAVYERMRPKAPPPKPKEKELPPRPKARPGQATGSSDAKGGTDSSAGRKKKASPVTSAAGGEVKQNHYVAVVVDPWQKKTVQERKFSVPSVGSPPPSHRGASGKRGSVGAAPLPPTSSAQQSRNMQSKSPTPVPGASPDTSAALRPPAPTSPRFADEPSSHKPARPSPPSSGPIPPSEPAATAAAVPTQSPGAPLREFLVPPDESGDPFVSSDPDEDVMALLLRGKEDRYKGTSQSQGSQGTAGGYRRRRSRDSAGGGSPRRPSVPGGPPGGPRRSSVASTGSASLQRPKPPGPPPPSMVPPPQGTPFPRDAHFVGESSDDGAWP
uniref:Cyclic nucleotide-binding domain-containing protein n=1 Tax=Chromera velia CCMP2878 TaxID=1169474 RepID=A0A0G4I2R9_9ALVE|eukprot:Cvel_10410.t1-p1 / transcript=Cvel_10410.t1 / gene=Cvel_10410 / organism=Chromera_velia_CCMP2878 / gene_product=hypothetical protein / transcript_product=hypothetical protein / location=Cvel_scaffold627:38811-52756(-) / protein_length=1843 / sequence_SO=supercontig / SO=protein_coding / is_pseudo=false